MSQNPHTDPATRPATDEPMSPEEIMAAAQEVFDRNRAVTGWLQAPAPVDATEEVKE